MVNEELDEAHNIPPKLLAALPADPFEQLDVGQRITSMAVVAGFKKLELETNRLRQKLGEKDNTIQTMQQRIDSLQRTLEDTSLRLTEAVQSQEKVTKERNALSGVVQKYKREISKLEMFKKNLLQSLQEDDESMAHVEDLEILSDPMFIGESTVPSKGALRCNPMKEFQRSGEHAEIYSSFTSSAESDAATCNIDEEQQASNINGFSAGNLSTRGSTSSFRPPVAPELRAPPKKPQHDAKVDGKEFFRQARNRLSYQKFSAFLANIKELNAHRQSREETLAKAEQIFGPANQDLFYAFDGLITRHAS